MPNGGCAWGVRFGNGNGNGNGNGGESRSKASVADGRGGGGRDGGERVGECDGRAILFVKRMWLLVSLV